jgi:hypothetical protein
MRGAQTAIESFDEGVLLWFARVDIMPINSIISGPFQNARLVNSVPVAAEIEPEG